MASSKGRFRFVGHSRALTVAETTSTDFPHSAASFLTLRVLFTRILDVVLLLAVHRRHGAARLFALIISRKRLKSAEILRSRSQRLLRVTSESHRLGRMTEGRRTESSLELLHDDATSSTRSLPNTR